MTAQRANDEGSGQMAQRSTALDTEVRGSREAALGGTTILDHRLVTFGRDVCGDLAAGLRREWLVTNGLGG
jgi:hypothetical protein